MGSITYYTPRMSSNNGYTPTGPRWARWTHESGHGQLHGALVWLDMDSPADADGKSPWKWAMWVDVDGDEPTGSCVWSADDNSDAIKVPGEARNTDPVKVLGTLSSFVSAWDEAYRYPGSDNAGLFSEACEFMLGVAEEFSCDLSGGHNDEPFETTRVSDQAWPITAAMRQSIEPIVDVQFRFTLNVGVRFNAKTGAVVSTYDGGGDSDLGDGDYAYVMKIGGRDEDGGESESSNEGVVDRILDSLTEQGYDTDDPAWNNLLTYVLAAYDEASSHVGWTEDGDGRS